jgi:hypothetical protein
MNGPLPSIDDDAYVALGRSSALQALVCHPAMYAKYYFMLRSLMEVYEADARDVEGMWRDVITRFSATKAPGHAPSAEIDVAREAVDTYGRELATRLAVLPKIAHLFPKTCARMEIALQRIIKAQPDFRE